MAEKKTAFRDAFREDYERSHGVSVDSLDSGRRSIAMTQFYVSKVLAELTPGKVPVDPEDLDACVADGPKDSLCDFIYRSDDGRVLIIQSKYRKKGKDEDPHEFSSFSNVLERLHPLLGKRYPKNKRVIDASQDIDWDTDAFELIYLTLGRVSDQMRAQAEKGHKDLLGIPSFLDRIDFRLIDEEAANDEIRNAESAKKGLQVPIVIRFDKDPDGRFWIKHEGPQDHVAYVGIVSAKTWSNLKNHRERLFNLNIRNYLGDKGTNHAIRETAERHANDFFFYNNGIAAVATKIVEIALDSKGNRTNADGNDQKSVNNAIECDQFSVVNGAQTVRSLIKAHKFSPQSAGEARVLLRVTSITLKGKDSIFLDNVTRYNNTQNPVRVSDFRSNDPVQSALATRFSGLARTGGKTYFYKNKRSEQDTKRIEIGMEEFAQSLHAFRFGTVDAFGGKTRLFDLSSEGRYAHVFGDGTSAFTHLTDDQFAEMAGIWFICSEARKLMKNIKDREVESAIKRQDDEKAEIVKAALERRWTVYSAMGDLLREKYLSVSRDLNSDLRKLGKPKWLDEKGAPYQALELVCEAVEEVLIKCYRAARSKQGFAQRNWYRSRDALGDIRKEIEDSKSIVRHLPLLVTMPSDTGR